MLEVATRPAQGAVLPPFLLDLDPAAEPPPAPAIGRHPAAETGWLGAALDELDYAILVALDSLHVVHLNEAARHECDDAHPLQLIGSRLKTRLPHDIAPLQRAVTAAARRGLRQLLALGDERCRVTASIVPLRSADPASAAVLIVLGKRAVCESLSLEGFARGHRLTLAETRVLAALCEGDQPIDVAERLHVAVSTVRTQIASIRAKTGAPSVQSLVRQLAVLPPLKGILRPTVASTRPARRQAALPIAA